MLLCLDVTHSGCAGWSRAPMWSQWEERLALQWSSSNGFLLDSLPKGFQALCLTLGLLSLCWSLGFGTVIIADKWKSLPTSNGVICFPALAHKWQQEKCTLCSTEFHYSAANLLELTPQQLAMLHVQKNVCVCVKVMCIYIHISTECMQL